MTMSFDAMSFARTFTHHTATVNGVRVHYVTGGEGEPVVLLHGFPETWYAWRQVMPALAKHYTVIVPDLRGLGDSERPEGGYDKKTLAEDIYQLVQVLGCGSIYLVGHDFGGTVAYMYAIAHPNQVRRLVLLEALMPGFGFEKGLDLTQGVRSWFYGFNTVPDLPEALLAGRERLYLQFLYRDFLYDPTALGEEDMVEYVRTYSQPGAMRAALNLYRALPQDLKDFPRAAKTKLPMPVLALGGTASMGARVLEANRPLCENIRGGVIEQAGHFLPEEQPEKLTEQLLAFFREEQLQQSQTTITNQPSGLSETFTHHMVDVNGVQIHYVRGGQGDPVVLLHGYPETWYAWRKVMPALAERYTVIAPDLRGLGDSSKSDGGYDKKTVAEDIYQLVRQLGFQHIFLVGADMGGPVAYAYAAAHPSDVRRFVFLESSIPGFGLEQAEDVTHGGSWHFGFFMTPVFPEMLTKGREREFLKAFAYRGSAYDQTAISEADIDEYIRCYAAPDGMRAGFEYYRALPQDAQDNQEFGKRKLTMPVLALDADHGFGTSITAMQAVATNVRGSVVKDCGHWIAEEQPEELTRQLNSFFAEEEAQNVNASVG